MSTTEILNEGNKCLHDVMEILEKVSSQPLPGDIPREQFILYHQTHDELRARHHKLNIINKEPLKIKNVHKKLTLKSKANTFLVEAWDLNGEATASSDAGASQRLRRESHYYALDGDPESDSLPVSFTPGSPTAAASGGEPSHSSTYVVFHQTYVPEPLSNPGDEDSLPQRLVHSEFREPVPLNFHGSFTSAFDNWNDDGSGSDDHEYQLHAAPS